MSTRIAKYVIDTCSLVELRRTYPLDVFPNVWEAIGHLADAGVLISSSEVFDELEASEVEGDDVLMWACNHENMFAPLDGFIQQKAVAILEIFENLIDLKKKKSSADPFVIATAMMNSCVVVSEETATNNSAESGLKVKIPDVCKYYNMPCISLLEMLRAEGIKFST